MTQVRLLATRRELQQAGDGHPVLRWDVGFDLVAPAYAVGSGEDGAVGYLRKGRGGRLGMAFLGRTEAIEALLADEQVRARAREAVRLSAPVDAYSLLERELAAGPGTAWEWLWTRMAPPPQPAEELLVRLGPDSKAELVAFLAEHNPDTYGRPFARPAQLWMGVRTRAGGLAAVGCSEANGAGIPHLAGITVAERHRRTGLGAAVTAYLTREALDRAKVCTLGVYADNRAALRAYRRLGYLTGVRWSSGEVRPA